MILVPPFFVPLQMLAPLWGLGMGMLWLGLREAGLIDGTAVPADLVP